MCYVRSMRWIASTIVTSNLNESGRRGVSSSTNDKEARANQKPSMIAKWWSTTVAAILLTRSQFRIVHGYLRTEITRLLLLIIQKVGPA